MHFKSMTEKPLLNQDIPRIKEVPAYLEARTLVFAVKRIIGGKEYFEIIPNPETKTCRIPATNQDPKKEITI